MKRTMSTIVSKIYSIFSYLICIKRANQISNFESKKKVAQNFENVSNIASSPPSKKMKIEPITTDPLTVIESVLCAQKEVDVLPKNKPASPTMSLASSLCDFNPISLVDNDSFDPRESPFMHSAFTQKHNPNFAQSVDTQESNMSEKSETSP
jgi:hypothetical protein